MDTLAADSPSVLLHQLRTIDISVPPRTEGRTTEHCQRWSICRFLSTFADGDLLHYPLRLEPGDRPDFVLALHKVPVGIEVTEAVPTDLARVDALQEYRGYDVVRFFQRFRPGEPTRSLSEIDRIARGKALGELWVGNSVETDWADVMTYFSLVKADRFRQPGFRRFDTNWLLIYDNWELPALNELKAAQLFQAKLASLDPSLPFDRVFVECEKTIWQFALSQRTSHSIVDL